MYPAPADIKNLALGGGGMENQAARALVMRSEWIGDGVLSIRLEGMLTAETLMEAKHTIAQGALGVRAFVADYRACVVALDGAGLDAVLAGERPGATPTMPAAMIVGPLHTELFMGHAARMALHSRFRRVFSDPGPAGEWARTMARRSAPAHQALAMRAQEPQPAASCWPAVDRTGAQPPAPPG